MTKLDKGQRLRVVRDHDYVRAGEVLEVVEDQGKRIYVKAPLGNTDIQRRAITRGDIVKISK